MEWPWTAACPHPFHTTGQGQKTLQVFPQGGLTPSSSVADVALVGPATNLPIKAWSCTSSAGVDVTVPES